MTQLVAAPSPFAATLAPLTPSATKGHVCVAEETDGRKDLHVAELNLCQANNALRPATLDGQRSINTATVNERAA